MGKALNILLVEDCADDAYLLLHFLKRNDFDVELERVSTAESLKKALKKQDWNAILCDYSLPILDLKEALALSKDMTPSIPFYVLSGSNNPEHRNEATKAGANGFISKDSLEPLADILGQITE